MLFRLALALGKTISELRATLSYREFMEWCLYFEIEPWGEIRADMRSGIVAASIHNVYAEWVGKDKRFSAAEFMPYLEKPEPVAVVEPQPLTDEELADWADAAIFGIAPDAKGSKE